MQSYVEKYEKLCNSSKFNYIPFILLSISRKIYYKIYLLLTTCRTTFKLYMHSVVLPPNYPQFPASTRGCARPRCEQSMYAMLSMVTLSNTCLVVRQMAASKCNIADDVSCCSPDGSLEVIHCQIRVLLFARWQPRSLTLLKTCHCCSPNGSLEMLHCQRRLLLFAR